MRSILIVVSSHDRLGALRRTGVWLEEFIVPYAVWRESGFGLTVASVRGGAAPVDPESLHGLGEYAQGCMEYAHFLENTEKLDRVCADEFDGIFFPGGHGPMWDLSGSAATRKLLMDFFAAGKLIAAVCHGSAALCTAGSLLSGVEVTGFSDAEEKLVKLDKYVPFVLEERLRSCGMHYHAAAPWSEHIVIDRNVITGQNPQSSLLLAQAVVDYFA